MSQSKKKYVPTLKEIRQKTAKIREGWDAKTEVQRSHGYTGGASGHYKKKPYTIPEYRLYFTVADGLVDDRLD